MAFAKLIGILGGWSLVIIALASWINRLSTERILSKLRRDEQATAERLRDELATNRALIDIATKSHGAGQDILQQKRVEAVGKLWNASIDLRTNLSAPVFFFGVLLPTEYDQAFENERVEAFIVPVTQEALFQAMESTKELEQYRAYLGEMLWLRFFIYRAFLGRLTHIILDGKRRKHLPDWRDDEGVKQLLSHVISRPVCNRILVEEPVVTAVNTAVNGLEGLMLEEISLIMSGRRSSEESFENARTLREGLASQSFKPA